MFNSLDELASSGGPSFTVQVQESSDLNGPPDSSPLVLDYTITDQIGRKLEEADIDILLVGAANTFTYTPPSVSTVSLLDGPATLQVTVRDRAGNPLTSSSQANDTIVLGGLGKLWPQFC